MAFRATSNPIDAIRAYGFLGVWAKRYRRVSVRGSILEGIDGTQVKRPLLRKAKSKSASEVISRINGANGLNVSFGIGLLL
jgi:hypothetical protein